jgi:hypothetical protein
MRMLSLARNYPEEGNACSASIPVCCGHGDGFHHLARLEIVYSSVVSRRAVSKAFQTQSCLSDEAFPKRFTHNGALKPAVSKAFPYECPSEDGVSKPVPTSTEGILAFDTAQP